MVPPSDLKNLIAELLAGSITHRQLSRLIHLCRSIVESFLARQRASLVHVCTLNGLTVSDLAADCIADIFARDEKGHFRHYERFVSSLDQPLQEIPDKELFLAFTSFVRRLGKTQLATTYAQSDSVGARIVRNIKDTLEKSTLLALNEDFRGKVIRPKGCDALDHLLAYPLDDLASQLLAQRGATASIPALLDILARVLLEQKEYRRSIPLIDVAQLLKSVFARLSPEPTSVETNAQAFADEDLVLIKREALNLVNDKIITTYVRKRKINPSEAQVLSDTLRAIISDWFEGSKAEDTYYERLAEHLAVSQQEYEAFWRKKIEYLTRVAREAIVDLLHSDF